MATGGLYLELEMCLRSHMRKMAKMKETIETAINSLSWINKRANGVSRAAQEKKLQKIFNEIEQLAVDILTKFREGMKNAREKVNQRIRSCSKKMWENLMKTERKAGVYRMQLLLKDAHEIERIQMDNLHSLQTVVLEQLKTLPIGNRLNQNISQAIGNISACDSNDVYTKLRKEMFYTVTDTSQQEAEAVEERAPVRPVGDHHSWDMFSFTLNQELAFEAVNEGAHAAYLKNRKTNARDLSMRENYRLSIPKRSLLTEADIEAQTIRIPPQGESLCFYHHFKP